MYSKHFLNVNIVHQKYDHHLYLFFHHLLMNKMLFLVVILDKQIFNKNQPIHMDMSLFFLIILIYLQEILTLNV